jgi:hypothetical protein
LISRRHGADHASKCSPRVLPRLPILTCQIDRFIKPHYHHLAEEDTSIICLSVDVDVLDELTNERGVSAMPTFQFYKNNVKVHEMRGANLDGLKAAIKQYK